MDEELEVCLCIGGKFGSDGRLLEILPINRDLFINAVQSFLPGDLSPEDVKAILCSPCKLFLNNLLVLDIPMAEIPCSDDWLPLPTLIRCRKDSMLRFEMQGPPGRGVGLHLAGETIGN